jgi:hypothetical protein
MDQIKLELSPTGMAPRDYMYLKRKLNSRPNVL